jgi:hypothetical protein
VGYCEVSKAFRIYILGHHHIEISRDVTFDEDAALKKSRRCQLEEVYEEEQQSCRINEGGSGSSLGSARIRFDSGSNFRMRFDEVRLYTFNIYIYIYIYIVI